MLFVKSGKIETLDEVRLALQNAIMLEHATIPPYLTAFFTISGTGPGPVYAAQTIHDIAAEEMGHLQMACNILNAVGGAPDINVADFIPAYPGPLPMGIGSDEPGGLSVGIERYSNALMQKTFMEIEEPEEKLDIPVRTAMLDAVVLPTYQTIGQFYLAIGGAIARLGKAIFTGDPGRQVPGVIEVGDVDTALAAIDLIVRQGEGTRTSPADAANELAHYYRFEELYRGMKIVPDASAPNGYAFDPKQPIVIDDKADIIQMVANPNQVTLDPVADWRAAQLAYEVDRTYTKLLNGLHLAFNGRPDRIDGAIAMMYELKNGIEELLQQQLNTGPAKGLFMGPRFQYAGP